MSAFKSYKILSVPGEVGVINLGTAADPSLVFGNPDALGGMNDGFYATATPTIGISINGTSVMTWSASGLVTGNIATSGTIASASAAITGAVTAASFAATGAVTGASVAATGAISSSSPTAGIGYATGSGGTITQGTNKATGVTLSTVNGAITMNNAALATLATVKFTVTNTAVDVDDVIIINHSSGGTPGIYHVDVQSITAGSFAVAVQNSSGTSASEAIVLSFMVLKGVAA